MVLSTLAVWPTGWSLIAIPEDDSYLALTYGDTEEPERNVEWDLSDEEDLAERKVIFADLLDRIISATVVDTDHLSGIVVDASGYDYIQVGNARGIFVLKSEDTGDTYDHNSDESVEEVAEAMKNYTGAPAEAEETEDTE